MTPNAPKPPLDHLEDSHKYFFAGFLNTAVSNFNMALNESAANPCSNRIEYIRKIDTLFGSKVMLKDKEHNKLILSEYIPILKRLGKKAGEFSWDQFLIDIKTMYETLDDLRNYYTHYFHRPIKTEEWIFEFLNWILFETTCEVKKERMKLAENRTLMQKKYPEEFKEAMVIHNSKRQSSINEVFNRSFWHLIYKNKGDFHLCTKAQSKTEDGRFSANGFLLFLSFFLDRRTMEQIFARTTYFRDTRTLKAQSTRWVFGYWSFRDVRRHLKSDFDHHALLLQMVDELTKCPKEIYDHLSTAQKEEFVFDLNEFYKDHMEYAGSPQDALVVHAVTRRRYEDKFTYFALRFLDEFGGFERLRFQVALGTYIHNRSQKQIYGTQLSTERSIIEHIRVFGKLSEISKRKFDFFERDAAERIANLGWQPFPAPHYVIDNGVIPFQLRGFDAIRKNDSQRNSSKLDKAFLVKQILGSEVRFGQPHAILSAAELPALLHMLLIEKKSSDDIEKIIEKKMYSQVNDIRYANQNKIPKKTIPKKLNQLIAQPTPAAYDFTKLIRHISYEIKICEAREAYINDVTTAWRNSKSNPNSKFVNKEFRLNRKDKGEICTWIANDIKRCSLKEERLEWKGFQHAELQAMFAFYKDKKEDIIILLEKNIGINIQTQPALKAGLRASSLEAFYSIYLIAKKKWLFEIIQYVKSAIKNSSPVKEDTLETMMRLFNKRDYEPQNDIQSYADEILKHPIALARGVFDSRPTYVWHRHEQAVERAAWHGYSTQEDFRMQKFYSYAKYYPNYTHKSKVLITGSKGGIKEQIRNKADNELERYIYANESRIRENKRKDVYILAMVRNMFKNVLNVNIAETINLAQVYQDRNKSYEIQQEANKQSVRAKGDGSQPIINDKYILSHLVQASILGDRIKDTMKIKDVGKFRRLELDQRVKMIITYDDKIWSRKEIVDFIERYELIRREEVFKQIHFIEQYILTSMNFQKENLHPKELEKNNNPHFKTYLAQYFLYKGQLMDDINLFREWGSQQADIPNFKSELVRMGLLLVIIRDKFAHQQLPSKSQYYLIRNYLPVHNNNLEVEKVLVESMNVFIDKLLLL